LNFAKHLLPQAIWEAPPQADADPTAPRESAPATPALESEEGSEQGGTTVDVQVWFSLFQPCYQFACC
jgi:hypothetical protein